MSPGHKKVFQKFVPDGLAILEGLGIGLFNCYKVSEKLPKIKVQLKAQLLRLALN